MDYSRFRFRSDIDWIEFEMQTAEPIRAWITKFRFGFSYVTACNPLTGEPYPYLERSTMTMLFRVRVQDPKNWSLLSEKLEAVNKRHPLMFQPKVIGIEVALDAYGHGATSDEMIELTAHLYKFLTNPVSDNHRTYHDHKGSGGGVFGFDSLVLDLSKGRQIAIGDKDADRYQHLYFKTTDSVRDGVASPLPVEQHRARLEITLRGAELPCQSLDEWKCFDFRKLTPYFNFRMLKSDLSKPHGAALEARAKQRGRLTREQEKRTRRKFSSATLADNKLNDIAKGSLRRLSDRW